MYRCIGIDDVIDLLALLERYIAVFDGKYWIYKYLSKCNSVLNTSQAHTIVYNATLILS